MNEQLENLKWLVENFPNINESMSFLITELEETQKAFDELDSDYINLINQNKRYREALEEILEEAYEEAGIHPDTGMQLETFIVKTARQALEGD